MSDILFIQFSNSGAYPPIQNAITLCLREGLEVKVLCVESEGASSLRFPEALEKITRRLQRSRGRLALIFLFLRFCVLVIWRMLSNRKQWLYASDPMSAPVAFWAKKWFGSRVVYHEHDAPPAPGNRFQSMVQRARLKLLRVADVVVMPNSKRLEIALQQASCAERKQAFTVWNCPLVEDANGNIQITLENKARPALKLYFHGSISPSLLPLNLLQAIKKVSEKKVFINISLGIAGYPTDGGVHLGEILNEAKRLDLEQSVKYLGAHNRSDLLKLCQQHDVGICFYDANPDALNHRFMAGASNKPFDYLSQGLCLLMSGNAEQKTFFADLTTAIFCDPGDCDSIAEALLGLAENASLLAAARTNGPNIIRKRWNYETQFASVLKHIITKP